MMSVATREESERRIAEAMRAQATGAGRPGFAGRPLGPPPVDPSAARAPARPSRPAPAPPAPAQPIGLADALLSSRFPLLLALLGGVVLGVALALLSLLAPGVLPGLG